MSLRISDKCANSLERKLSSLKHCNALEGLKVTGSRSLVSIPISDAFPPSLCQFVIEDCAELSSLQGGHASPEELSITNCPKLWKSSVANHGKSQTALWKLVITSCGPEMTSTPSALLRTFLYTIAYPFAN
ncbi:hypothetical protein ACFX13_036271 [Malus domestica]